MPEQDSLVPEWAEKSNLTFPILVGADTDRLVRDYRIAQTPLNLILNSAGKIVFRQEGFVAGHEERLEAKIRESLQLSG